MKKLILAVFVFLSLLIAACNSNQPAPAKELSDLDKDICTQDADCKQLISCGCHTKESQDILAKGAKEEGVALVQCTHPENTYCRCDSGLCVEHIR